MEIPKDTIRDSRTSAGRGTVQIVHSVQEPDAMDVLDTEDASDTQVTTLRAWSGIKGHTDGPQMRPWRRCLGLD